MCMSEQREGTAISGKEARQLVAEGQGARVAVLGGGVTGRSLARLFLAAGLKPVIVDESSIEDRADLVEQGVCVVDRLNLGSWEQCFAGAARPILAVASPSVLRTTGLWHGMSQMGVPVISEMDFALAYLGQPTVAITGTNGKTTTVSLLAHLFASAGRHTLLLGNVGTPFSAAIDPGLLSDVSAARKLPIESSSDIPVLIAEVSSYQLDSTRELKPLVAGCLNITVDHIEKHGDMKSYVEAKSKIFQFQAQSDLSLYYADDPQVVRALAQARRRGGCGHDCPVQMVSNLSHDVTSGLVTGLATGVATGIVSSVCGGKDCRDVHDMETADGVWVIEHVNERGAAGGSVIGGNVGSIIVRLDGVERRCELTGMHLWGAHNMLNIGFAVAACLHAGLSIAEIESGLKTFQPLEHRLEIVTAARGIWVNDSKSTNIDSVAVALRAVIARFPSGGIYLMIGGISKGGEWRDLLPFFSGRVVEVVLFGRDRWEIASSLILKPFVRQLAADSSSDVPLEGSDGELLPGVEDVSSWVCFANLGQAVAHVKGKARDEDIVLFSPGGASFDEFRNYEHRGLEFKSMVR